MNDCARCRSGSCTDVPIEVLEVIELDQRTCILTKLDGARVQVDFRCDVCTITAKMLGIWARRNLGLAGRTTHHQVRIVLNGRVLGKEERLFSGPVFCGYRIFSDDGPEYSEAPTYLSRCQCSRGCSKPLITIPCDELSNSMCMECRVADECICECLGCSAEDDPQHKQRKSKLLDWLRKPAF